jgi:Ran GTPase-activating protein (RanGAP) involved in mRNA processing and transport
MDRQSRTRIVVDRMFTDEEVIVILDEVDMPRVVQALMAENVRVKKLTLIMLRSIGDAETLRDAFQVNTSVKELSLEDIDMDCFVTLAQGMAVGQNVKKLSLYRVHIDTEEDFITFQAALRLIAPFVEDFILEETDLCDAGARVLAEILRDGNSFRELNLGDCYIGSEGAAHLAGALRVNTSLQVFKLSNNFIGNTVVISLAKGLVNNRNTRVLHLVACNMVGSEGAAAVGRLLEANATIEELSLSHNTIGDAGSIALVNGLARNQRLVELNLRECGIGDDGAKRIGRALKTNIHLERLDLRVNAITEKPW